MYFTITSVWGDIEVPRQAACARRYIIGEFDVFGFSHLPRSLMDELVVW